MARPTHKAWHADSTFVYARLLTAHACVETRCFSRGLGTVVGHEQNNRVIANTEAIDRIKHAPDVLIDGADAAGFLATLSQVVAGG